MALETLEGSNCIEEVAYGIGSVEEGNGCAEGVTYGAGSVEEGGRWSESPSIRCLDYSESRFLRVQDP